MVGDETKQESLSLLELRVSPSAIHFPLPSAGPTGSLLVLTGCGLGHVPDSALILIDLYRSPKKVEFRGYRT